MDPTLAKVQDIRSSSAKFFVVDLHMHSPSSHDWDNSPAAGEERDTEFDRIPAGTEPSIATITKYRQLSQESGRELVAITDHNVFTFGEMASATNGDSGIRFLPGIEITAQFGDTPLIRDIRIHILAIFPENTSKEAIARILPPGSGSEADRDPRQIFQYETVNELIELIHRENGIACAAHIESNNGLRCSYKRSTELLLEQIDGATAAQEVLRTLGDQVKDELVKFDAIQVRPSTDTVHYRDVDGELRVALFVATDTHKSSELSSEKNQLYTYIKMSEPTFAFLKDALRFPDLRIRHHDELPESKPPKLHGLRLVSSDIGENTFFEDTTLGFSDNLSCIIGPRGSGKSAAIDALRYLMGYNRNLSEIDKVRKQVLDRQAHTLENTRIEAIYQSKDHQFYKLVATYDPQEEYMTEVFDLEGNKINIDDIETHGDFPLNLFGWGELELLGSDPDSQRELLDRFIPELQGYKEQRLQLLAALATNRAAILEHANTMGIYFTDPDYDFNRVQEFKERFDELNKEDIEAAFGKLDTLKAKRQIVTDLLADLKSRLDDEATISSIEVNTEEATPEVETWWNTLSGRIQLIPFQDWIKDVNSQHKAKLETAIGILEEEENNLLAEEGKTAKEIREVIGEEQSITGDLRNKAKERYEKAAANKAEYERLYEQYDALLKDRDALLERRDEVDKLIFASRNGEITRIKEEVTLVEDDQFQIDLVLNQQSNRSTFVNRLADGLVTFKGQWRAGHRADVLANTLTPRKLATHFMEADEDALTDLSYKLDGTEYRIRDEDANNLISDNCPYIDIEGMDLVRIEVETLSRVLEIQELPIEDDFFITLSGKPIEFCSPGQRCSAMLPVVTLTSQAPLVIDQPEDNLDNRLVSRALFKILSRLKETRQLILATHNPNILVSGDAEQVLLLNNEGSLEQYGSIDSEPIIESILNLMEGGAEAFERRQKRYERLLN